MYSSRLFNSTDRNHTITKKEVLIVVYVLHRFRHYLLSNMFTFFVDHIAFIYLVNKPHVFGKLVKWFLLLLEYEFKFVYKLGKSHLMADALNRLPN
jgi:hypothetical protein